jgi:hypothetical protein
MGLSIVLVLAFAIVAGARLNERFRVRIRAGRIADVRGRVPAVLLDEFAAVAREARVARATIRAVRDLRGTRLVVSEGVAQRLHNVFGVHGVGR